MIYIYIYRTTTLIYPTHTLNIYNIYICIHTHTEQIYKSIIIMLCDIIYIVVVVYDE